jgi:hypothetical protein
VLSFAGASAPVFLAGLWRQHLPASAEGVGGQLADDLPGTGNKPCQRYPPDTIWSNGFGTASQPIVSKLDSYALRAESKAARDPIVTKLDSYALRPESKAARDPIVSKLDSYALRAESKAARDPIVSKLDSHALRAESKALQVFLNSFA